MTAGAGCAWTASSNNPWITVTSGSSGSGAGTVGYSVASNSGSARTGTITIAGQTFTVSQQTPPVSSNNYWIPVATHSGGQLGSQWRTDIGLNCAGASAASATLTFSHPAGASSIVRTINIAAGQQVVLRDVVGQTFGVATGKGPIQIGSTQPLVVTSRTFNDTPQGTFGQDYDGFSAAGGLTAGESAVIGQLAQKDPYRSSIGITNMGTINAVIGVTLCDGNGTALTTFDVTVAPGAFWQEESFKIRIARNDLDTCYAKITVKSGSGILAHASLVDGRTNDPTTFWAKSVQATPSGGSITGRWSIEFTLSGYLFPMTVNLTQQGTSITGDIVFTDGSGYTPILSTSNIVGQNFSIFWPLVGASYVFEFRGTVTSDFQSMSGSVYSDGSYRTTFTGHKTSSSGVAQDLLRTPPQVSSSTNSRPGCKPQLIPRSHISTILTMTA